MSQCFCVYEKQNNPNSCVPFALNGFSLAAKTQELQERLKCSIARFRKHLENVHAKENRAHEKKHGRRKIKTGKSFYL